MTVVRSAVYTCDNPACTNGEGNTPATSTTTGSLPTGWMQLSGGGGGPGASLPTPQGVFDTLTCATAYVTNVYVPSLGG